MGLNIDLAKLLGLSTTSICPACNKPSNNMFDHFDIECGNPNPSKGVVKLNNYCNECDHEYTEEFHIVANKV